MDTHRILAQDRKAQDAPVICALTATGPEAEAQVSGDPDTINSVPHTTPN